MHGPRAENIPTYFRFLPQLIERQVKLSRGNLDGAPQPSPGNGLGVLVLPTLTHWLAYLLVVVIQLVALHAKLAFDFNILAVAHGGGFLSP